MTPVWNIPRVQGDVVPRVNTFPVPDGRRTVGSSGPQRKTTVVLVEPRVVPRRGVQQMLRDACPGAEIIAVADSEEAARAQCAPPATVMLSCHALAEAVHCLDDLLSHTGSRLVLLGQGLGRDRLHIAADLPVDAVLREEDISEHSLAEMLTVLDRGVTSVSRETMRELLSLASETRTGGHPGRPSLSPRELDALRLMSSGLSNRQMARAMHITEHGVKRHVANILVKLGCNNRTMAVALGLRMGLIDDPSPTV